MRRIRAGVAALAILLLVHVLIASSAQADVLYVCDHNAGKVGLYHTDGTPINANLITGLGGPTGVTVSGTDLYVTSTGGGNGKVGKYTTTGGVINANLITGLFQPQSVGVSGTDLLVASSGSSHIGKYTTSGATINANFITTDNAEGLSIGGSNVYAINTFNSGYRISAWSIATGAPVPGFTPPTFSQAYGTTVHGSDLYAVYANAGQVNKYNAATGALLGTPVTGLPTNQYGIAVSDTHIYLSNFFPDGVVAKYTLSGSLVDSDLIAGLDRPYGIALAPDSAIPEPGATGLFLVVGLSILNRRR